MKNRIFIGFIVLLVLATIFHFSIKSTSPTFIVSKVAELMRNQELMDSIGGSGKFEFTFNRHDLELRDTLRYTITITGTERILTYEGVELKTGPNLWTPIDETIIIK